MIESFLGSDVEMTSTHTGEAVARGIATPVVAVSLLV